MKITIRVSMNGRFHHHVRINDVIYVTSHGWTIVTRVARPLTLGGDELNMTCYCHLPLQVFEAYGYQARVSHFQDTKVAVFVNLR